ncbi:MAG: hypothetical protein ACK47C_14175 [Paracoccaceae bacterium]
MRRVGDVALLAVQWALVLWGLYLFVVTLHLYAMETNWAGNQTKPLPGKDFYILPSWQRFVVGMTTGTFALGLGAVLFYLRRLYLSRHQ